MQRLELTLPTPAENVALDEALLEWAESSDEDREVLRLWESPRPMVVAGRSSRVSAEIDLTRCDELGIPIVRRSSGGAAIVAGPGCLMYAVVLSYKLRPALRDISRAHTFVMDQLQYELNAIGIHVVRAGTSDLVIANGGLRKFSGNSLRVKRSHCLYHGTLLYDFDLPLISSCLKTPPRQPEYREARQHDDFVMNLPLSRTQLIDAVSAAFPTDGELADVPLTLVEELVATRFGTDSWNYEFA
jgi:lipoate---protein ligase